MREKQALRRVTLKLSSDLFMDGTPANGQCILASVTRQILQSRSTLETFLNIRWTGAHRNWLLNIAQPLPSLDAKRGD